MQLSPGRGWALGRLKCVFICIYFVQLPPQLSGRAHQLLENHQGLGISARNRLVPTDLTLHPLPGPGWQCQEVRDCFAPHWPEGLIFKHSSQRDPAPWGRLGDQTRAPGPWRQRARPARLPPPFLLRFFTEGAAAGAGTAPSRAQALRPALLAVPLAPGAAPSLLPWLPSFCTPIKEHHHPGMVLVATIIFCHLTWAGQGEG